MDKNGFKIGQRIYVVITHNQRVPSCQWCEIIKTGRRWADFKSMSWRGRFDMSTREVDGGDYTSPGKIYLSEDEYGDFRTRQKLWEELRR